MSAPTQESPPHHLLFVCSGNICRSPMAEGIARSYADRRGQRVSVLSAGTLGIRGRPADPLAVKVMRELGIDISGHQSQGVEGELIDWASYVLVMEMRHAVQIRGAFPAAEDRILLLGNFGGLVELPDPIGGWRWKFRRSRDQIERCVTSFMDQLPPRPML